MEVCLRVVFKNRRKTKPAYIEAILPYKYVSTYALCVSIFVYENMKYNLLFKIFMMQNHHKIVCLFMRKTPQGFE